MKIKIIQLILVLIIGSIFFSGCSSKDSNKQSFEERIWQTYSDNGRLDKYNQLIQDYGENKVILLLNEEEDSWWITNFTLWTVFSILPDIPDILAGSGVLGIFYLIAWWTGVTLAGGGILAVLAAIGGSLGGIPGIPPAIMGIIYFGVMFAMLSKLFGLLF